MQDHPNRVFLPGMCDFAYGAVTNEPVVTACRDALVSIPRTLTHDAPRPFHVGAPRCTGPHTVTF